MPMRMKTHVQVRIALMFAGFFFGVVLFAVFQKDLGMLAMPAFFIFPLGGAFGLQLAFSNAVSAACPTCGGAAFAGVRRPERYLCGNCQTATNGVVELSGGEAGLREQIAAAEKEEPSRARRSARIFLVLGVLSIAFGVFLGMDTVRLLRHGVSTEGRVANVTSSEGRDKDGNSVRHYTAHIQFMAGERPRTMQSGWTEDSNGRCSGNCFTPGQRLKIIYLADDPEVAKVDSFTQLYLFPGLPLSVGLAFVVFALAVLRRKS